MPESSKKKKVSKDREKMREAVRYSKSRSREGLYENLKETISTLKVDSDERILNIGAGGEIQKMIEGQGLKVTSVDIDPDRKPDVVASLTNLEGVADQSISVIFCMEVLEHVDEPWKAIEEVRRVLKPGGTFVGSTPFMLGLHDRPYDFYRYTKYGIRFLFREFDEVLLKERNSYADSVVVLPLRLLVVSSEETRKKLLRRLPLIRLTEKWLRYFLRDVDDDGCTTGYFFVFRKAE